MNTMTLVTAAELAALVAAHEAVLIVDCRADLADAARAHAHYLQAHLPGAHHADLERDLSDLRLPRLGRHPLPDAADFSATLGRWGWTPEHLVVAYDDMGGALAAARLWWMMRAAGHRARVLDGGLEAWQAAGLPLQSGAVTAAATPAKVSWQDAQWVGSDAVQAGLADHSILLMDARAAPRFRGETEPLDKVAGHVPGAVNRPFSANLGADGTFKSPGTLRDEFQPLLGDRAPDQVVHMCGSGVTACQNLLAMEHAGLQGSRLFAPSWSGWISDPRRPTASGA